MADVYTRRLDEVKKFAPQIKTYQDFRKLLDDKSVDAVLIATPQHQHVLNFVPALQAGKDIYQEKTMAFNPDHAKRMRKAFQGSGRVVQIGIQSTSSGAVAQAKEYLTPDKMGTITAIHTHHYRNAPYGGWKRAIPADCDAQHVDWPGFQGEAKKYPFDPNRVINWRFYWDYAGGNVYENMVHQVGFWYKLMGLKIPASVTMTGGNYLSPEMEVPDTMDVSMNQPENLLFTWNSMFGNRYFGEGDDLVLGNKGTVLRDDHDQVRYEPQDKPRGTNIRRAGRPGRQEERRHRSRRRRDGRAHAELLRLHADAQGAELSLRDRLPLRDRLLHGDYVLSRKANRPLGRKNRRGRLTVTDDDATKHGCGASR